MTPPTDGVKRKTKMLGGLVIINVHYGVRSKGERMKHGITYERDGKVVAINVATDLPYDSEHSACYIIFKHVCNSESHAELLLRYLTERHCDAIQEVRKCEFFSGWQHAKAKKHGKAWFDWFHSCLESEATWK